MASEPSGMRLRRPQWVPKNTVLKQSQMAASVSNDMVRLRLAVTGLDRACPGRYDGGAFPDALI